MHLHEIRDFCQFQLTLVFVCESLSDLYQYNRYSPAEGLTRLPDTCTDTLSSVSQSFGGPCVSERAITHAESLLRVRHLQDAQRHASPEIQCFLAVKV